MMPCYTALLLLFLWLPAVMSNLDPCTTTELLPQAGLRGSNIVGGTNGVQLCDDTGGSFRIDRFFATVSIDSDMCGTERPYFLLGAGLVGMPMDGETAEYTACQGLCLETVTIHVTKCGMHYVAQLPPLDCSLGASAYCLSGVASGELDAPPTQPTVSPQPPVSTDPADCILENNLYAPWLVSIEGSGLCARDQMQFDCEKPTLLLSARNPVQQGELITCHFREIWVDSAGAFVKHTVDVPSKRAEYVECNKVKCEVPALPTADVELHPGWLISVSRDGVHYGNERAFIPHDDRCWQCAHEDDPACGFKAGFCSIGNTCYQNGDVDPMRPCRICNTIQSTTSWSVIPGACLVSGLCFTNLQSHPTVSCLQCIPTRSQTQFSVAVGCFILGSCIAEGAPKSLAVPCETCQSVLNPVGYSITTGFCSIDNACVQNEFRDPLNACNVCRPNQDPTGYTVEGGCSIGGSCVPEGFSNPINPCSTCVSISNQFGYTATSGCPFFSLCVPLNAPNPSDSCQVCSPGGFTTRTYLLTSQVVQDCEDVCSAIQTNSLNMPTYCGSPMNVDINVFNSICLVADTNDYNELRGICNPTSSPLINALIDFCVNSNTFGVQIAITNACADNG